MIFFFYGPNTYAAKRKLRDMTEAYIKKAGSDFGLERIEGEKLTQESLHAALMAVPFLAASRFVIIEGLGANKAVAAKVPAMLTSVPESTVAVFYEPDADQRTTYFKEMVKATKDVKFDKLNPARLKAWAAKEVQALGGRIDNAALGLLIEATGDDQWRMHQEIQKLVNFDASVTAENVKLLVESSSNESIFDLVEAMSSGRTKSALGIYKGLIAERTNEIYILTMITWQLRNLLLAKTAGSVTPAELAKRAGMSPYVASKALAKQREFDEVLLEKAFLESISTDRAIKTGKGEAEQLVESLIYKVASKFSA